MRDVGRTDWIYESLARRVGSSLNVRAVGLWGHQVAD